MTDKARELVPILEFELLSSFDSMCHGLTTRAGGVSEPPYDELNLGLHVGDHPVRVIENRRRACAELGVEFESCTFAQQVHGEAVRLVGERQAGAGRTRFEQGIPAADGLLVKEPGVTVAVTVADCVPIVIYDVEHHAGAVVHAGWAGTTAAIAAKAVGRLTEECGSRPAALVVGIGPCIGPCCYQIGEEVAAGLSHGFAYAEPVARPQEGGWRADLAKANWQQLRAAGVPAENIELSGICTSCEVKRFYSHRRQGGTTGRFGAFLSLR